MTSIKKPSELQIDDYRDRQNSHGFSYPFGKASVDAPPANFDADHNRVQIGIGRAVYEVACEAIRRWAMFPHAWTEVYPAERKIRAGDTVAVLFRVMGLWWLNACRIIDVLDETEPVRRFGFTYGTLPGHVECGEERFSVEWHADDSVWYDLRAFSRPRHWLLRLGYPIARRYQRRFVRDSQAAMREAVRSLTSPNVVGSVASDVTTPSVTASEHARIRL
jgi:uncharacterized protein (UPF0548 family)